MSTLLERLSLPQKFTLLSLVGLLLAAIPSVIYYQQASRLLDAAVLEAQGLEPMRASLKTIQLTQQHRGVSSLFLSGAPDSADKRSAKQTEAEQAYALLDGIVKATGDTDLLQRWNAARADWFTLRENVGARRLGAPESNKAHAAVIAQLLKVNELIGDFYGLSTDPEKATYQLIQAMNYQQPYLTEELGRLRAGGTAILAKKAISQDEAGSITGFISRAGDRSSQMLNAFGKASRYKPAIDQQIGPAIRKAGEMSAALMHTAEEQIVRADQFSMAAPAYLAQATAAIDAQFEANAQASKLLDTELAARIASYRTTRWTMGAAMLALVAFAAALASMISGSVTLPLRQAIAVAREVAHGDLSKEIDVGPDNEVGQLLRALRQMTGSLREIVGNVRASVDAIGAATGEIASGNADVSRRLEAQASSLEETASSMEQLTSAVRQNSDNAREANDLVRSAADIAEHGGEVVDKVVQTMGEINASSRKIVDIIAVIDGIAFQTNILALNAAVEAARAGEQGRGFAVVASEVRSLAQRSAAAAKEIKELINSSVERVDAGNLLAADAGAAMTNMLASVQRVTSIMGDMHRAAAEQGSGIEQVNMAVIAIDQTTQQNAALVEETAAASASLDEQAHALVQAMSIFTLGTQHHEAQAAARPRAGARKRPALPLTA